MAADGLGAVKDPRAIEPLVKVAQGKEYVGEMAMKALRSITGERFYNGADWSKWWDQNKMKFKWVS